jgi:signal transduction histidine kinase
MSHELRTPLNAIIGYSEMLQEEVEDLGYEDITPDLNKIQTAGQYLLSLINDILDISKIEAGKMELYLETFDLSDLLDSVVTTIQPMINKNDNRLVVHYDPVTAMYSDQTKVRQILFNLLSNACKFTQKGTVTLTVQYETAQIEQQKMPNPEISTSLPTVVPNDDISIPTSARLLVVIFQVSDTGIGMSPEQLERLFKAFSQADASTTRKYGGTGLGLVISQRFCYMMGGNIQVESASGRGTTFTVYLPVYVQKDTPEPKGVRIKGQGDTLQSIQDHHLAIPVSSDSHG